MSGLIVALAIGAGTPPASSLPPVLVRYSFREIAMGCEATIEVATATESEAIRAASIGFKKIREIDEVLSDYLASSEVRRLSAEPDRACPISECLFIALERSLTVAAATEGAFDPACGALSRLWREARASQELPSAGALLLARDATGFRHLTLDRRASVLTFDRSGMSLDFGGIAKGLAAQAARDAIVTMGQAGQAGHGVVLVSLAGDVACGEAPPWGAGWRIAIETCVPGDSTEFVLATNLCLSTSGDAEQHLDVGGSRRSHIFDPRTGEAVTESRAVTVMAINGWFADALATALSVDPPLMDRCAAQLSRVGGPFEARIVRGGITGAMPVVATTAGFARTTPSGLVSLSGSRLAAPESPPAIGAMVPSPKSAASAAMDR